MDEAGRSPREGAYAVVFISRRTEDDGDGYEATALRMEELVRDRPGYLGMDSVRDAEGVGITVSYWTDLASIRAWREDAEHREAQGKGRELWYTWYRLLVCRVEEMRAFGMRDS